MSEVLHIQCSVCKRQVDCVEWWTSDFDRMVTIRVRCHGSTEERTMSDFALYQLQQASGGRMPSGTAFDTPLIGATP